MGQGFVRPSEADWIRCAEDEDCAVVALGGASTCVDPRGVMAVQRKFVGEAVARYGATREERLRAPITLVTCEPLVAKCLAGQCALLVVKE